MLGCSARAKVLGPQAASDPIEIRHLRGDSTKSGVCPFSSSGCSANCPVTVEFGIETRSAHFGQHRPSSCVASLKDAHGSRYSPSQLCSTFEVSALRACPQHRNPLRAWLSGSQRCSARALVVWFTVRSCQHQSQRPFGASLKRLRRRTRRFRCVISAGSSD